MKKDYLNILWNSLRRAANAMSSNAASALAPTMGRQSLTATAGPVSAGGALTAGDGPGVGGAGVKVG